MEKLNLNIDVKVKLTAFGESVLARKKQAEYEQEGFSEKGAKEIWMSNPPDKDGFRHFQLYELMNVFGNYLTEYADKIPFEGNSIMVAKNEAHPE